MAIVGNYPGAKVRKMRPAGVKQQAYSRCSNFHIKVVNGKKREFYYHATKGWRNRAA